jgi:hypothetical protein
MTTETNPNPEPAPARTSEQIKDALLANATALEENTEWWRRDELIGKRAALYAELEKAPPAKTDEQKPAVKDGDGGEEQKATADEQGEYEIRVPIRCRRRIERKPSTSRRDAAEIGREAGIDQPTMQTLYDFITDVQVTCGVPDLDLSNPTECVNVLHNQYGAEADAIIRDAKAGAKMLGAKGRMYLDATGLGNAPSVLVALAHFYRGDFKLSPESAQAELTKLRSSKGYQAGERSPVDRGRLLGMLATRAGGDLLPPKPQRGGGSAKPQDTNAELTKLRMDPAYWDKSAPNHKATVARVHELMKELYGDA